MSHFDSLPVENVQELASHDLKDIPHRYIRPELEFNQVSSEDHSLQIPVINMAKFSIDQTNNDNIQEMEKLHNACKHWGFFQLINHGESEGMEKMKVDVEEFFKLPLQEKMSYAQLPNSYEGFGQSFVVSNDQKLDWADLLFVTPLPVSKRNMNFWPTSPTTFISTLDNYSSKIHEITLRLLTLMAINLGVEPQKLRMVYEDGAAQAIRMNYYPPCLQANKVIGISPHSDAGLLTLLIQVNDVPGLQIKNDGKWVPVIPLPGAIIVNIGDLLEIMSNGVYSSIEHRAVVSFQKERLSIAAFHGPSSNIKICPLSDLVKENGANYKEVELDEYTRMYFSSKLDGKNILDQIKIKQNLLETSAE